MNRRLQSRTNCLVRSHVALQAEIIRSAFSSRCYLRIDVEAYDRGAASQQRFYACLSNPRRCPRYTGDLPGEHWRRAGPAQFRLLQVPVFEPEKFLFRKGAITAERFRPQDDIDGVGIKIARDCGLFCRTANRAETKFRIQNHTRRRVEHRLGFFGEWCVASEVFAISNGIFGYGAAHQRQAFGAQNVIRRGRAALRNLADLSAPSERKMFRVGGGGKQDRVASAP